MKARCRSRARIFARMSRSGSRRTVSHLLSVGQRLMGMHLQRWFFHCKGYRDDGRFRVVTADGIWLGYLRRLITNFYENNQEECKPNTNLLKAGSIIMSESIRRFLL